MNPPNSPPAAPLTNKLILLVLSGIFICLVLLAMRAFDRPPDLAQKVEVSVTAAPEVEPGPESVSLLAPRDSQRLSAATSTRTQVVVVLPRPLSPRPTPRTAAVEDLPEQVSETIGGSSDPGQRTDSLRQRSGYVQPIGGPGEPSPSVTGSITLAGNPPPEIPIHFGPACGKFSPPATTRHYVIGTAGGLANVFVYVEDAKPAPVPGPGPLLDQVGCMYEPYVLGVGVNQKFGIRNSDPEIHNVHATPKLNKEFNFSQFGFDPPRTGPSTVTLRAFDRPEVMVRLKCDLHPWMFAYVGVVDHPWFAVSDATGIYQIPQGLPVGRYRLTAVHLKAGIQTQEIIVEKGQPAVANFRFRVPGTATPQTTEVARENR